VYYPYIITLHYIISTSYLHTAASFTAPPTVPPMQHLCYTLVNQQHICMLYLHTVSVFCFIMHIPSQLVYFASLCTFHHSQCIHFPMNILSQVIMIILLCVYDHSSVFSCYSPSCIAFSICSNKCIFICIVLRHSHMHFPH
jgi:hypothetical protein